MSVRRGDDGTIILDGICPVEDAEPLLEMLQEAGPAATVDWSHCTQLHTAVLQVIIAAGSALAGDCGDAWVRRWVQSGAVDKSDGFIHIGAVHKPPDRP